jgi:hypothetical protein
MDRVLSKSWNAAREATARVGAERRWCAVGEGVLRERRGRDDQAIGGRNGESKPRAGGASAS